jgi:hypothetical protein
VLRGKAAIDFAAAQTDDTPFLVGGWVSYEGGVKYCALGPPPGAYSWRSDCYFASLADAAGSWSPALNDAITFHYVLDQMYTGPTVVVVRVRDPRAQDCGAEVRSTCDRMMVVQRVVWEGDAATGPGPLTSANVRAALARVGGVGRMGASCTRPPWFGCGLETLASADMYPFTVADQFSLALLDVNIEPTAAALHRAIHVDPGVDGALKKAAVVSHVGSRYGYGKPWIWTDIRWLVVDNVAVLISVHSPATAKDRQFMARIVAALEAEVTSGTG